MFYGRQSELKSLRDFVGASKSGLIYVRGRRRVGKSLLLQQFKAATPRCFYFSGRIDASDEKVRCDFAQAWSQFVNDPSLGELQTSALTWDRLFKEITKFASQNETPVILIFDEIQWIAKTGSGFIGKIKEHWLEWEQTARVKVILCGSSSKFFESHVGGEAETLRGLSTQATLWVPPFTLSEVERYYLGTWTRKEIAFTYMMLGGIPYYLERLSPDLGFIQAVNEAVFTSQGIFLQEIDEILKLEFNAGGKRNVFKILSALGQDGRAQKTIVERTGLPQATVSGLLEKLCDYQLIFEKYPVHTPEKWRQAGTRFFMKDFYLNFYFQVLDPMKNRIQKNTSALLFSQDVLCSNGFYVENFSGKAFELLVRSVLENRSLCESLFRKMLLKDPDYSLETYWDDATQIDLAVENKRDRITRIIECKWTDQTAGRNLKTWVNQLAAKKYPLQENQTRKNYLVISEKTKASFQTATRKNGVVLVGLSDLFV